MRLETEPGCSPLDFYSVVEHLNEQAGETSAALLGFYSGHKPLSGQLFPSDCGEAWSVPDPTGAAVLFRHTDPRRSFYADPGHVGAYPPLRGASVFQKQEEAQPLTSPSLPEGEACRGGCDHPSQRPA